MRGRGSESRCRRTQPRCLVSRRVESSRSPSGFGIRNVYGRSSPARRARVQADWRDAELDPRVYLVAGTLEPFSTTTATRWAVALRVQVPMS